MSGGHTNAAPAKRRARAVESFGSAADCIGSVEPGMSLFAVTRGQFSMLDIVSVLIKAAGHGCAVSVWTWALAEYEVACFEAFMQSDEIASAVLVVDRSAEQKNASVLESWRARFGNDAVRVCKNHAKIATVTGGDLRLLARGSMNLNYNPRFEQFDITEGGEDYELVASIEAGLPVLPAKCSNTEARAASGVNAGFGLEELTMFRGVKPWKA